MDDFFTVSSLATLTGCVAAVVVIVNTARHAFNWGPRWFGLVLSLAVAIAALHISAGIGDGSKTDPLGWVKYLTAVINGCLIYTSAFGLQNTMVAPSSSTSAGITLQGIRSAPPAAASRLTARSPW